MAASTTMIVGTRKGVFLFREGKSGWRMTSHSHEAAVVPYAFHDHRNDRVWVSLDHGHW